MQSMLFRGVRHTVPQTDSVSACQVSVSADRRARIRRFATFVFMIAVAAVLGACSAGSGGDNGVADSQFPDAFGLNFTYPFDGQQDVARDTQMVVVFPNGFEGDPTNALRLQIGKGAGQPTLPITVVQDDNQPNILRLIPSRKLAPNTTYRVVANRRVTDGDTFVNENVGLFSFTTRPLRGTASANGFNVVETTPGETNPATGRVEPFAAFNALRVRFSEPVNPATVTQGQTFTFTGPGGQVPGRLTVLGRNLTFDPANDLAPGNYTLTITGGVTSQFGNSLTAYTETKTVSGIGKTSTENTNVFPTASTPAGLPDSPLSGLTDNVNQITAQLIGVNNQIARTPDDLNSVMTTLAQPGLFNDSLPAVIRAGQKVRLSKLSLSLNGDIPTPIVSGPIDTYFANDTSVYIHANDLRNLAGPSAVQLRADLAISTLINALPSDDTFPVQTLANGLFNQTVLNVQAAGLAIPQPNGDLSISTVGSFPIKVNRNLTATVNLTLTLVLPGGDQNAPQPDNTAPFLTAQSPSACLYVFGLNDNANYNTIYASQGVAPPVLPELACAAPPPNGAGAQINSFPIEASPAVVFSEPVDPSSVNANSVSLTSGGGTVPATLRVEGSSVVINPVSLLTPDTTYSITLNSGGTITDLAGNDVAATNPLGPNQQTLTFTTEPQSAASDTAPLLGELSPGIPCALTGGDFQTGGDNAGNCVGDQDNAQSTNTFPALPVFQNPANVKVDAYFSELVNSSSIVLADGCLTGGANGNTVAGATVAVQQMDGSGQCVGAVPGQIAIANAGDPLTRGFTFRPYDEFVPGTRYWIVVCGTGGQAPGCTGAITDDEDNALNTDPLNGTGSTGTPAAGGPDIIMPFDAIAPSINYYTSAFTLPEADTNGSGQLDADENPQPGNRALVNLTAMLAGIPVTIANPNRPDGAFPSYQSLQRPIAIRETLTSGCNALSSVTFDNGDLAVGATVPDQCIQNSLLTGGINALTSLNIGAGAITNSVTGLITSGLTGQDATLPVDQVPGIGPILGGILNPPGSGGTTPTVGGVLGNLTGTATGIVNGLLNAAGLANGASLMTGRIILRFPNAPGNNGLNGQPTQSGFIVEKCTGTFPNGGPAYDFEPCFVAGLKLVANAPDGVGTALPQQTLTANVVGPVAFEQNGRLVISVRNTNTLTLNATALGMPATATINPGDLNFQLVGNANHGGRAFPSR